MRKMLILPILTLCILCFATGACAESLLPPENGAFFDWASLATYSGAIAAVVFIVQFLKLPLDKIGHVPTRAVVYAVSFLILLCAQYFTTHVLNLEAAALAAMNAAVVSFAAMGLYERAVALPESGKLEKKDAPAPVASMPQTQDEPGASSPEQTASAEEKPL